jgi:hypothetical protein
MPVRKSPPPWAAWAKAGVVNLGIASQEKRPDWPAANSRGTIVIRAPKANMTPIFQDLAVIFVPG